jgi:DNA polymerase-1
MKLLTFDLESDGFVHNATRIWCAASCDHSGPAVTPWAFEEDPADKDEFLAQLGSADVLIGHNVIAHDLPLLRRLWGWQPSPGQKVVDTLLMSRLLNPDRPKPPHCPRSAGPHSVEAWGYRLGSAKQEHNEWDRFSAEMLSRCVQDVRIQVKIYNTLLAEAKEGNWGPALRLTMGLWPWLVRQEEYGFAVDERLMRESVERLTRWMLRIDRAISPRLPLILEIEENKVHGEYGYVKKPFKKDGSYSAVTERFLTRYATDNLGVGYVTEAGGPVEVAGPFARISFRYVSLDSNEEVKDFLLKTGWVPQEWNVNNAGERTTPKMSQTEEFEGVQGSLGKLVAKRVVMRQRKGVIEGWLDYLTGSSTSSMRLPGAIAGLAVTGRARHRLIVNVPGPDKFFGKQMRSMFIATPQRVLVGVDSKGNQIRQLAARMGDDEFTSVVLDPSRDIHSYNRDRAGLEPTKAGRHKAKTFFYALVFGAGDPKIARTLGSSVSDAKQLRSDFMGGMPAMQALLSRLETEWTTNRGWIRGLDGRPIYVPGKHQLLVYLLQSDEAIQMSHAYLLFVEAASTRWRYGDEWAVVLWMHDELQIECVPHIAEEIGQLASWAIAEAGRRLGIPVPHEGEYKIGTNWMETH